jgi:hypothetical protein
MNVTCGVQAFSSGVDQLEFDSYFLFHDQKQQEQFLGQDVTSLIIRDSMTIRLIEQDDASDAALCVVNENPELGLILCILT